MDLPQVFVTTASTALLMGLVGGSHCLAMCAAPCGALVGQGGHERAKSGLPGTPQPLHWRPRSQGVYRGAAFHGGRLAGYAAAGALAAWAMDSLAWLTQQTVALRPAWTMAHVAVLAWGLMLMIQAHQPEWVERAGRVVWERVQPVVRAPGGLMAAGFLWALMPCGLLYSALLVAALSGSPMAGGVTMLLFGLGSGGWLLAGPWLWRLLRARLSGLHAEWGTRLAGGMLCAVAAWALWMDLIYKPSLWCR